MAIAFWKRIGAPISHALAAASVLRGLAKHDVRPTIIQPSIWHLHEFPFFAIATSGASGCDVLRWPRSHEEQCRVWVLVDFIALPRLLSTFSLLVASSSDWPSIFWTSATKKILCVPRHLFFQVFASSRVAQSRAFLRYLDHRFIDFYLDKYSLNPLFSARWAFREPRISLPQSDTKHH